MIHDTNPENNAGGGGRGGVLVLFYKTNLTQTLRKSGYLD